MPRYYVNGIDLTAVADAIREKAKIDDILIFPNDFISAIQQIVTQPIILQDSEGYLYFPAEEDLNNTSPVAGVGEAGYMELTISGGNSSSKVDEGQADYMIVAEDDLSSYIVGTGAADYMAIA